MCPHDHVQAAHRRRVRILHDLPDTAGERIARSWFSTDIGIDIAPRQRRRHFTERHANGLQVADRHALHPQAFQNEHLLRRTRPDGDPLALQVLQPIDRRVFPSDDCHALVAGGTKNDHRFVRRGAENPGRDAERAKIDRSGDDRGFAVGRAFERHDVELVALGQKPLIKPGRDRVDQLQRPHLDRHRFGLRDAKAQHGRCGQSRRQDPTACYQAMSFHARNLPFS